MKSLQILLLASALVIGGQQAKAIVYTSGTMSVNQIIPDGNSTGYSTSYTGSGWTGEIGDIKLTLNVSGGFNGDLYAYLTHDGVTAILLNRIGSSGAGNNSGSGINVTFTLDAASNIHNAPSTLSALTGYYLADGRDASPLNLGAVENASSSRGLNQFLGKNSSGNWTLFIADVEGGGVATLENWELEITAVPEPANVALGIFGGVFATWQGIRILKKKKIACI